MLVCSQHPVRANFRLQSGKNGAVEIFEGGLGTTKWMNQLPSKHFYFGIVLHWNDLPRYLQTRQYFVLVYHVLSTGVWVPQWLKGRHFL